jgi:uncharacterized membrane protein
MFSANLGHEAKITTKNPISFPTLLSTKSIQTLVVKMIKTYFYHIFIFPWQFVILKCRTIKNMNTHLYRHWLTCLISIVLAIGIFVRFVNLGQKAYWIDECFTSLMISGNSTDVTDTLADGRVIGIEELQKYQYPNSETSVIDTIEKIAIQAPILPPLYFIMGRFWLQCFGNSVATIRSLSAAISLLALPCIYWLCWELFGMRRKSSESPLVAQSIGWMAIALISVSPFHVLYAQEARPYSLLTLIILLSHTLLLRAIRLQTKMSWLIYAITLIMGLYSHLFFIFVVIAHAIYVLVIENFRFTQSLIAYLIASALATLAFCPWMYVIFLYLKKLDDSSKWENHNFYFNLFKGLIRGFSLLFIDFEINESSHLVYLILFALYLLFLIGLLLMAIYIILAQEQKQIRIFLAINILLPYGVLLSQDILTGRLLSTLPRYLIPCYLVIQIAVAYLLSIQFTRIPFQVWQQKLYQISTITLISMGVVSCLYISQSETWWTKADSNINHSLARIINQEYQPILVSDTFFLKVICLSHLLNNNAKYLLVTGEYPRIPDSFTEIFLYDPSPKLTNYLERNYKLQTISEDLMFKLTKKTDL